MDQYPLSTHSGRFILRFGRRHPIQSATTTLTSYCIHLNGKSKGTRQLSESGKITPSRGLTWTTLHLIQKAAKLSWQRAEGVRRATEGL